MFKNTLTYKQIRQGSEIPRGYRFAYVDIMLAEQIAYPIGIHYLVMFGRWLHYKTYWVPDTQKAKHDYEVFHAGYQQACEDYKFLTEEVDQ